MSFDLVVIPPNRADSAEAAADWIDLVEAGVTPTTDETAALTRLAARIEGSFVGPTAPIVTIRPGRIELDMAWTSVAVLVPEIVGIARDLGLDVLDPQAGRLHRAADAAPAADAWASAAGPSEAVLADLERGGPASDDPIADLGSPEERVRAGTALGLAWAVGPESAEALVGTLQRDSSRMVRALAAQSLLIRGEVRAVPAVAALIRACAVAGDRESLDAATLAAGALEQAATHGSMGFAPRLSDAAINDAGDAIASALAVAERLRSRHRRALAAIKDSLEAMSRAEPPLA